MFKKNTNKSAASRPVLCASAVFLASITNALGVNSEPVGVRTLPIATGPNFVAAPLHNMPVYEGLAMSLSGAGLRVTGSPFWAANELGPKDGFNQYIVILKKDASATPGNQGDWYFVGGNTADSVTLITPTGAPAPASSIGTGDEIEIIKLTSLADMFGTGAGVILNKDNDGISNTGSEDVINTVNGTSFDTDIIYHSGALGEGTEGYYVAGNGPFDGTTVTFAPDEPVFVFRLTAAINAFSVGAVQTSRLSHYLVAGPNPISTGFAMGAPVGTSNLEPSGWVHDTDGISNPANEDVAFSVVGTSFDDDIFYTDLIPGWAAAGEEANTYPFQPGVGYFFFRKASAGTLIWRQAPPY